MFKTGILGNGTNAQVDGDTIFEIGYCTKVFTELLALEMERRGELKIDEPVAKLLLNPLQPQAPPTS